MELTVWKGVWKSVITVPGALSAMIHGPFMMPMWPVDNLDSEAVVSSAQNSRSSLC